MFYALFLIDNVNIMSILKCCIFFFEKQSRSDDTLLTVDAIYGQGEQYRLLSKSRMGRYFVNHLLRLYLLLAAIFASLDAFSQPKWSTDESRFPASMTLTAIAVHDFQEMRSEEIEIGAFCGDDCRGSVLLRYEKNLDRYFGFLLIFGDGNEKITLKVYDHATGEEYLANNSPITFKADDTHNSPINPYVVALGTTDESYIPSPPVSTGLTVKPATATLPKGATQQFTVTVTATGDVAEPVTWLVSGNNLTATRISAAGLLAISTDETATTLIVMAISDDDNTLLGTATVTIALLFDDYVITKWDNTFMLNVAKLEDEGHNNIECKWYRNGEFIDEDLSYTAGESASDKLSGAYYFELTTNKGNYRSTEKVMNIAQTSFISAYPNPVRTGSILTLEGVTERSAIEVYSQTGTLVIRTTATAGTNAISINVPSGLYIIRTNNGELKFIVE